MLWKEFDIETGKDDDYVAFERRYRGTETGGFAKIILLIEPEL